MFFWKELKNNLKQMTQKMKRRNVQYYSSVCKKMSTESLKTWCHPKVPKELSYKELQEKLKLRFEKRVSFFRKRIEFDKMFQQEGEKVAEWYSRVRE